ncbi:hypothetical protein SH668x_000791 [Planctomicrobium sp. SH668]|uniref:hypothetical protein n=1 Tax=Planctomicrobium sp. SH668 TaxID=3448126 RepID=UPI003F5C2B84
MSMSRRQMMTYSLATVAMTLTGCKTVTTTVVLVNETGGAVSINASGSYKGKTFTFKKSNIGNGRSAKQKYVANVGRNNIVPFTIHSLSIGGVTVPGPFPPLSVVTSQTNTFTLYEGGSLTPPEEEEEAV